MKLKLPLIVTALSGLLAAGCGDSSETASPSTSTGSSTAAPETTETASPEASSGAMDQAANEIKEQVSQAVTQAQEEARKAYEDLSQKLVSDSKAQSDALLKSISEDLETQVKELGNQMASNESVMEQLNAAVQSLLGNEDVDAVKSFNQLKEAKLTPEQTTLVKDVYNAGAALVTQRNLSGLETVDADVNQLVNSVWQGNYTSALQPLQNIWSKAELTTQQKDLLSGVFDQVAPGWKDSAGKLQEGLDAIKQFNQ